MVPSHGQGLPRAAGRQRRNEHPEILSPFVGGPWPPLPAPMCCRAIAATCRTSRKGVDLRASRTGLPWSVVRRMLESPLSVADSSHLRMQISDTILGAPGRRTVTRCYRWWRTDVVGEFVTPPIKSPMQISSKSIEGLFSSGEMSGTRPNYGALPSAIPCEVKSSAPRAVVIVAIFGG